jgi:hypothetical protein
MFTRMRLPGAGELLDITVRELARASIFGPAGSAIMNWPVAYVLAISDQMQSWSAVHTIEDEQSLRPQHFQTLW